MQLQILTKRFCSSKTGDGSPSPGGEGRGRANSFSEITNSNLDTSRALSQGCRKAIYLQQCNPPLMMFPHPLEVRAQRRRLIIASAALIVLGASVTYFVLSRETREPRYHGRSLSAWLEDYSNPLKHVHGRRDLATIDVNPDMKSLVPVLVPFGHDPDPGNRKKASDYMRMTVFLLTPTKFKPPEFTKRFRNCATQKAFFCRVGHWAQRIALATSRSSSDHFCRSEIRSPCDYCRAS
jgi:hypothetical protein